MLFDKITEVIKDAYLRTRFRSSCRCQGDADVEAGAKKSKSNVSAPGFLPFHEVSAWSADPVRIRTPIGRMRRGRGRGVLTIALIRRCLCGRIYDLTQFRITEATLRLSLF